MKRSRTTPWVVQVGFAYLGLLFAIAIAGAGLAATGIVWSAAQQREREAELLFIGDEFRRAIALYYYRTPGEMKEYPKTLEELLEDRRFPGTQRYLRRIYRDPMTGSTEWGLVTTMGGRIMGVHSVSRAAPMRVGNFPETSKDFVGAKSYAEWKFIFIPVSVPPRTAATK